MFAPFFLGLGWAPDQSLCTDPLISEVQRKKVLNNNWKLGVSHLRVATFFILFINLYKLSETQSVKIIYVTVMSNILCACSKCFAS